MKFYAMNRRQLPLLAFLLAASLSANVPGDIGGRFQNTCPAAPASGFSDSEMKAMQVIGVSQQQQGQLLQAHKNMQTNHHRPKASTTEKVGLFLKYDVAGWLKGMAQSTGSQLSYIGNWLWIEAKYFSMPAFKSPSFKGSKQALNHKTWDWRHRFFSFIGK